MENCVVESYHVVIVLLTFLFIRRWCLSLLLYFGSLLQCFYKMAKWFDSYFELRSGVIGCFSRRADSGPHIIFPVCTRAELYYKGMCWITKLNSYAQCKFLPSQQNNFDYLFEINHFILTTFDCYIILDLCFPV